MSAIPCRGLACVLVSALVLAAPPCAAESTFAQGSGALQTSARLAFRIVVPGSLRVAVADGGSSLDSRLVSGRGALTVTAQENGIARPLPVAQSERNRAEAHFSGRLGGGVYTVASP